VVAVGWSQIIAWGTTLYALGVAAKSIMAETGWSRTLVFGGLTVGLLVAAIVSAPLGAMIDRHGAQRIMTAGAVLAAICLVGLAFVADPASYLAIWAVLGLAMRMTLYDAAFAGMVQVAPRNGRRAISYLTLFGGFASTVFWPIGQALAEAYGWRTMFLVFAALNLLLTAPLNWFGLAWREIDGTRSTVAAANGETANAATAPKNAPAVATPLTGRERTVALVLFGIVGAASAFIFGAMAAHLPGLLEATGISAAAAITLAAYKGLAQVAGRTWELIFGQRLDPLVVGRIALAFMPLSFAALIVGGASFATALVFTTLFGIANGLVTIVRGAVPLHLFGSEGYGAVLGILAVPYLATNAIAPLAFALIIDRAGYAVGEWVMLAAGLVAVVSLEVLIRWHGSRPRPAA
jgi:MFS family permease